MNLDAFNLTGKNALVTGSRTGLGRAMAIGLAEAGANVMVHGSKENRPRRSVRDGALRGRKIRSRDSRTWAIRARPRG